MALHLRYATPHGTHTPRCVPRLCRVQRRGENKSVASLRQFPGLQAPRALPTALPALPFGANQGSSGGGSSSSSNSSTNASSSTSALSSSSAPSSTSDYVPSESMSDGPAACPVTRAKASRPKNHAQPKSTGKRACNEWDDDSDAGGPPHPSLLYIYARFCASNPMTASGVLSLFPSDTNNAVSLLYFGCLRIPNRSEVPDEKVLGLGQPRGGAGVPPPPYNPQNGCTPLGVTHWLAAAP